MRTRDMTDEQRLSAMFELLSAGFVENAAGGCDC